LHARQHVVVCGVANDLRRSPFRQSLTEVRRSLRAGWRDALRFLITPLAIMWLLEVLDQLVVPRPGLDVYGIRPRTEGGLWGIALAPWLHRGFAHLAANSVPLVAFAALVLTRGRRTLLGVTAWVVALGGLGVWLIGGANTVHLGASGLVFGYFGYLLTVGWLERRPVWIMVSLAIAVAYGGLLRGALPTTPGISWEGHLCGLVAGAAVARFGARRAPVRRLAPRGS
jgi:membrane associated rhomboid family serine protease